MNANSLLYLGIFGTFVLMLVFFWSKKLEWDKRNRRRFSEKLFFTTFGFLAVFICIDNWFLIRSVIAFDGNKVDAGIASMFEWWGIYAFLLGIVIGALILSFVYKKIMQTVKQYNTLSFYDFLKARYSKGRLIINIISKITFIVLIPILFFQIKVISLYLFPSANQYLMLGIISLVFVLLFLFMSNKDTKVTYLTGFILMLIWFVFAFYDRFSAPEVTNNYTKPDFVNFLVIAFWGLSFYLVHPKNFTTYTNKKVDILKISILGKALFLGSFIILIVIFYLLPIGGWKIENYWYQPFFLLILSFSVCLAQLYYMKSAFYSGFKKYSLRSRFMANIWASVTFIISILAMEFIVVEFDLKFVELYSISLTYLPILLPGFIGAFIFKRAKSISLIFSFVAGFSVWWYMVITEKFLGYSPKYFISNSLTQTFFPFITAVFFYLLPLLISRKKELIAMSFDKPEEMIIESFLISSIDSIEGE